MFKVCYMYRTFVNLVVGGINVATIVRNAKLQIEQFCLLIHFNTFPIDIKFTTGS